MKVIRRQVVKLFVATGLVAALATGSSASALAHAEATGQSAPPAFSSLSCLGDSFCVAVGTYSKPGHSNLPLIEQWKSKSWQILPTPFGFFKITCGGSKFCLAGTTPPKGSSKHTLLWNGRTWTALKYQSPDDYDLICESPAFCITFGSLGLATDIVQLTSKGWISMPGAGDECGGPDCVLTSLSCYTATNCQDSGSFCTDDNCDGEIDFTETWNGTIWYGTSSGPGFQLDRQAKPGTGQTIFGGPACAGLRFCMAVGIPPAAEVSHNWEQTWQDATGNLTSLCAGRTYCVVPGPLACGSPWFCVVLPSSHPAQAVTWHDGTWKIIRTAKFDGHFPSPNLLSCGAPGNCAAIDVYQPTPHSQAQPVAEHWNGSSWQVTPLAPIS